MIVDTVQSSRVAAAARSGSSRAAERRFYLVMTCVILLCVVTGFGQSFFLRPFFPGLQAPSEPLIFVHGAIYVAWFILLVVQAYLITTRRVALHRTLGFIGAGVAGLMIVSGVVAALVGALRPGGYFGLKPTLPALGLELSYLPMFGALVAVAVLWRRDVQLHKRLMLLANISVMPVALARFPVVFDWGKSAQFWLGDTLILALVAWDLKSRGRIHKATLYGAVLLILWQRLTMVYMGSPQWGDIANHLVAPFR